MESLKIELFERPLYIYVAAAVAVLVLLAMWWQRRDRKLLLWMIAPVAVAGAVTLTAWLVVTDREQLKAASRDIADAVVAREVPRIMWYLDDSFEARIDRMSFSKAMVEQEVNLLVDKHRIEGINFGDYSIAIEGRRATMIVNTKIFFDGGMDSLTWEIIWTKRPAGWRILTVGEPQRKLM